MQWKAFIWKIPKNIGCIRPKNTTWNNDNSNNNNDSGGWQWATAKTLQLPNAIQCSYFFLSHNTCTNPIEWMFNAWKWKTTKFARDRERKREKQYPMMLHAIHTTYSVFIETFCKINTCRKRLHTHKQTVKQRHQPNQNRTEQNHFEIRVLREVHTPRRIQEEKSERAQCGRCNGYAHFSW